MYKQAKESERNTGKSNSRAVANSIKQNVGIKQYLKISDNRSNSKFQHKTIQRLIATDAGAKDDFVLLASIGAYLKHKGDQKVQVFPSVNYNSISPGSEALFVIAHGGGGSIAGMNPKAMKNELETKGRSIPVDIQRINLAACESGKSSGPQKQDSYAHKLRNEMGIKYKNLQVLGVPGEAAITDLETANEAVVSDLVNAEKIDDKLRSELDVNLGMAAKEFLKTLDSDIKTRSKQAASNEHIKKFFSDFHKEKVFDTNAKVTRAK